MLDVKSDFPIFTTHPDLVYLDSAATSQKPQVVVDAINNYYTQYCSNIHRGLYPIAEQATAAVEDVRKKVASFINAKGASEIIFTKSATEGMNLITSTWGKFAIAKNDVVITTIMEHHANFVPWQQLCMEKGANMEIFDITDDGRLHIPQAFIAQTYRASETEFLLQKAKVLTITAVSNVLGTITPLAELIKKAKMRNKKLIVVVDGSQMTPHMQIDVQKLDIDFLVFTGHKMLAGTGVGVVYAKKELLDTMSPYQYGGDMIKEVTLQRSTFADAPSKFEAGTLDIASIISLGVAIEYLQQIGFTAIQEHEQALFRYCLDRMKKISGVTVYGPVIGNGKSVVGNRGDDKVKHQNSDRAGILSFEIDGIHPHDVAQFLGSKQICIRAGHHCAMPLHKRLGLPATSRVSLYLYNTEEDIDKLIAGIKEVKKVFR